MSRSNGSHSPFRPTRLSPAGWNPCDEYDDPALGYEQEADAAAERYIADHYNESGQPFLYGEDR
jgi:hypothetical protein